MGTSLPQTTDVDEKARTDGEAPAAIASRQWGLPVRKASPNDVIDSFVQSTSADLADWQIIDASLHDLRLRRRVASDAFLALAVAWETFLSQWLIAAVNRDSSTAVTYLSQRLQDHATNELRVPQTHVSATLITKNHFTLDLARQLLDPHDSNVVLRERRELKVFADRWLAASYRQQLAAITSYQFKPVLATRLVRNALAHQSESALKRANDELRKSTMPLALRVTTSRRLNVDGWRRYLLSITSATPRLAVYHTELATTSQLLRVS